MECLIAIGSTVAVEISKTLVVPIYKPIGYLIYYKRNIKNLEKELQKLDAKRIEVELSVNDAKRNLQVIFGSVIRWQEEVDEIDRKGKEFLQNEMKANKCLNYYSMSREAKKMTDKVLTLVHEGSNFGQIANPDTSQKIELWFNDERIKNFESRASILNEIWMALQNDDLRVVGICGMSGVGKTTVVKQLLKSMEMKKLFDEFAMVVVSDNPNFKKIQNDIASCLGLKFQDDDGELVRASKLRQRLTKCGKRILLILDDVWKDDDHLKDIGVPLECESNGCKIVMTSRNGDVCSRLGSQKIFQMKVLDREEAWILFKETTGCSMNYDLYETARQIVNECGGLPIAIVTIANVLKGKSKYIWNDALRQLKNSNLEDISGLNVFSAFKLSYNYLENEEAKSCFLLCSLYPEDFNVRVEDLVRYGMGLKLFKNAVYVHEGRDRVHMLIDMLKGSNLLLEGDDKQYESVKMHDLVRDAAISIAYTDKQWCTLQSEARIIEWRDSAGHENCTAMSLMSEEINKHINDLECPKLELLQILYGCQSESLPNNVFEGMKEVKVLDLSLGISSLPQSIDVLKNLRTFRLLLQGPREIHTIGVLVKLEILEIGSDYLQDLPSQIGELKNLRVLDLLRVKKLRYIPEGVLLKLSKLEELYVAHGYMIQRESLSELEGHHMSALQVTAPKASDLPDSALRNLIRFNISIYNISIYNRYPYGSRSNYKDSENVLLLQGDASDIKESGICALFRKVEFLYFNKVRNFKNVADIDECVDALVSIPRSLESPLSYFSNLRNLDITSCYNLKYFIPLSMARGLKQLHGITVESCQKMEGIFFGDQVDDEIESELVNLRLDDLPNFIGFTISKLLNKDMKQLGPWYYRSANGQSETESAEMISILFSSHCPLRLSKLQDLTLEKCDSIKMLFPPYVAQQFVELKHLKIRACYRVEYIVAEAKEEEKNKSICKIAFPNLISLHLEHLPKFVAFCADNHISFDLPSLQEVRVVDCYKMKTQCSAISDSLKKSFDQNDFTSNERGEQKNVFMREEMKQHSTSQMKSGQPLLSIEPVEIISILFPPCSLLSYLQELLIWACPSLKVLFSPSVAQKLVLLKTLRVFNCEKMEYVVAETGERTRVKLFPNLIKLHLIEVPSLMAFCKDNYVSIEWHLLESLKVDRCPRMKTLCFSSTSNMSVDPGPVHVSKEVSLMKNQEDPSISNNGERAETSCSFLSKLIQWLQNLKYLYMDCGSVEVIFSFEGLIIKEYTFLNSLETIYLKGLPNLKHLCFKIPPEIRAFQNLQELIVRDCGNLLNLLSIRLAKSLVLLREISITGCKMMEEIIGIEDEENQEQSMQQVVLPQLSTLELENLPNLKGFYSGIYALHLPELKKIKINSEYHELVGSMDLNTKVSELFQHMKKEAEKLSG